MDTGQRPSDLSQTKNQPTSLSNNSLLRHWTKTIWSLSDQKSTYKVVQQFSGFNRCSQHVVLSWITHRKLPLNFNYNKENKTTKGINFKSRGTNSAKPYSVWLCLSTWTMCQHHVLRSRLTLNRASVYFSIQPTRAWPDSWYATTFFSDGDSKRLFFSTPG